MTDVNVVLLAAWQKEKEELLAEKQKEIDYLSQMCESKRLQTPLKALLEFNVARTMDGSEFHNVWDWGMNNGLNDLSNHLNISMAYEDIQIAKKEKVELLTWRKDRQRVLDDCELYKATLRDTQRMLKQWMPSNQQLNPDKDESGSVGIRDPTAADAGFNVSPIVACSQLQDNQVIPFSVGIFDPTQPQVPLNTGSIIST